MRDRFVSLPAVGWGDFVVGFARHTSRKDWRLKEHVMQVRLSRSSSERMVAGVCGGLAEYFNIDPVIVRLIFVLVTLTSGLGLLIYLLLWMIIHVAQPFRVSAQSSRAAASLTRRSANSVSNSRRRQPSLASNSHRRPHASARRCLAVNEPLV